MCKESAPDGGYTSMDSPLLLPLRGAHEATVLIHALTAFAYLMEADGDPCGDAPIADEVSARLRALHGLASVDAEQMLLSIGLGRRRDARQG